MNFTYLKYFRDTAEQNSIQKAAKLNFVSQPAISQGIKKLELELEISLLNHKRNSIELTKEGKEVLKISHNLFNSIKDFQTDIGKIKNQEVGEIIIGISNSLVKPILTKALNKFNKLHPGIDIKIKIGKTNDQKSMLDNSSIDLGISLNDGKLSSFNLKTIKKGKFNLVSIKKSRNRLLITEDRPETILFRKSLEKNKKITMDSEVEVESWSTILSLVQSGYGKGFLPDFILTNEKLINQSKEFKLIQPDYEIVCFTKHSPKKNSFLLDFINCL